MIARLGTATVTPEVRPGPGGGGGGGGGGPTPVPGCNFSQDFGGFNKGSQPSTVTFTFTNQLSVPVTFTGVKFDTSTPGQWSYDASQLTGTIRPGEQRTFTVTFNPPSS